MERVSLALGVLFISCWQSIFPQTSIEMRQGLGKPVAEIYRVDKEITVSVSYGKSGEVCFVGVSGKTNRIVDLADEVVPAVKRGMLLSSTEVSKFNSAVTGEEKNFEKLVLRQFLGGAVKTIEFRFKEKPCIDDVTRVLFPENFEFAGLGLRSYENPDYFYDKYEATKSATLSRIPPPKLTPEAIEFFTPGEMIVQGVLRSDGTIANLVFRGSLPNGMMGRVKAAIREIRFTPAQMKGRPVAQRVSVKYGIKRCENGKICTYAEEVVD